MIKKYWRSQFKWLFLSSILESIGANLFGIVLLMMIAANFTGTQRGWLITAASIVNIMPAVLSAVTGYYADRTANKINVSRIIRCCQMVLYLIIAFYAQSLSIATILSSYSPFLWLNSAVAMLVACSTKKKYKSLPIKIVSKLWRGVQASHQPSQWLRNSLGLRF
ncbi:hypothetical protein [Leuconostoc lactis]|uniref:hypothetical protein n=1 Tax=Leuconostoc lactis TaxID=1246 RepID=UPI00241C1E47|nr:hypothetical protein [Leuconostoc lactis]